MAEHSEMEGINKVYKKLVMLWIFLLTTFPVFLYFGHKYHDQFKMSKGFIGDDVSLVWLNGILFALSVGILFIAGNIRKSNIAPGRSIKDDSRLSQVSRYPVVAKYHVTVSMSLLLCHGIAIFGFVLFIMRTDFSSLYIFIAISAAATFYFRPRKQEMIELMQK